MIPYLSTLPQPSVSFSGESVTPVVRTDIPNGLIEQYGRYSTGRETYNLQWKLSDQEFADFEEWFSDTLKGGVLIFELLLPEGGAYEAQPVRFTEGIYKANHTGVLYWNVSATVERMVVRPAPTNRTPAVPQWLRLGVNPAESQNLTLSHRNARLTVTPDDGSTTTFRIYPPTDSTQYIYFGLNNQGLGETLITSEDVEPIPSEPVTTWPGTLPKPNASFSIDASQRNNRLEMDSGHSRQYAASKFNLKRYSLEFDLTLAQLQTFQDFFYTTLRAGSLPFFIALPVDGAYNPVRVRFVGGKYSETYSFNDTFRISAEVDRLITQSVFPEEAQPFPLFYSPSVNVTANRKIQPGDAGKLFIVDANEGETISLHIGAQLIEFGILVIGLGNVLVTRTPFIHVDEGSDDSAGTIEAPFFELVSTIVELGELTPDGSAGTIGVPLFELESLVVDIDDLEADSSGGEIQNPAFEILEVLEDLGSLDADDSAGEIRKPIFALETP